MITPPLRPPGYSPVEANNQVQQNAATTRAAAPVGVTAIVRGEPAEQPDSPDSKDPGEGGSDRERPGPPPTGARGRVIDIKA